MLSTSSQTSYGCHQCCRQTMWWELQQIVMDQGNHVIIDRISLLKVSKHYLASKITTNSMVTLFFFLFFFFFLVGSSNQATVKNIADVIKQKWSQFHVWNLQLNLVESCIFQTCKWEIGWNWAWLDSCLLKSINLGEHFLQCFPRLQRERSSQVWASSTPKQTKWWWWWWTRRTSAKSRTAPHKWIEQWLVLIHHVGKRLLSRGCCYN